MPNLSDRLVVLVAALSLAVAGAALAVAARSGGSSPIAVAAPGTTDAPAPASQIQGSAITINHIYRQGSAGVGDVKVSAATRGLLSLHNQVQAGAAGAL